MTIFVTADQHFNHPGILEFETHRKVWVQQVLDEYPELAQLTDVQLMNEYLVNCWNKVVKPTDTVYVLGDFFFGNDWETLDALLNNLNGKIVLVKGNHDHKTLLNILRSPAYSNKIQDVQEVGVYLKYLKIHYYMTHFPMNVEGYPETSWKSGVFFNLHGHLHTMSAPSKLSLNVGVDQPLFNGYPRSLEFVEDILLKRQTQTINTENLTTLWALRTKWEPGDDK